MSVGSDTDVLDVLIPRGNCIPHETEKREYTTSCDRQSTIDFSVRGATLNHRNHNTNFFQIYEGQDKKASRNLLLGEFTLTGLPEHPAGYVRVETVCKIDADAVLTVSAAMIGSGGGDVPSRSLTVDTKKKGQLTPEEFELVSARMEAMSGGGDVVKGAKRLRK